MPHSQQKSDSDKWIPFKNLWVISQKSSWIAREITYREAACVPQNKCVTLNEEVICFDWHWRKKCIEAFYAYESECVSVHLYRDEAGKQQCPLRRVHPHRGLVTRWAAGSPLSLASWGRLSAGNSERTVFPSQKKKMISISSSPHTNVPLPQWWAGADSEQRITLI